MRAPGAIAPHNRQGIWVVREGQPDDFARSIHVFGRQQADLHNTTLWTHPPFHRGDIGNAAVREINQVAVIVRPGRFEVRRFRPNIVIRPANDDADFAESSWVGRKLSIGDEVVLEITDHTPRCVMTTLAQDDLPNDSEILRTAARYNDVHVGVYTEVRRGGRVQRGDTVTLH